MCSAASRDGRRLSMQQIVACEASTDDPKARYHDLILPEDEEAHSYYYDLSDTSSLDRGMATGLQCRTGASVHTRGAEFSVGIRFCTELIP